MSARELGGRVGARCTEKEGERDREEGGIRARNSIPPYRFLSFTDSMSTTALTVSRVFSIVPFRRRL